MPECPIAAVSNLYILAVLLSHAAKKQVSKTAILQKKLDEARMLTTDVLVTRVHPWPPPSSCWHIQARRSVLLKTAAEEAPRVTQITELAVSPCHVYDMHALGEEDGR